MKNVSSFCIIVFLCLFASCSKDVLEVSHNEEIQLIQKQPTLNTSVEKTISKVHFTESKSSPEADTTMKIQVEKVSESHISGEYLVDFSADYDFTQIILEEVQYLDFTDASGNNSKLTFTVNNSTGGSNSLSVTFAIGANNLSGLILALAQEIIIIDEIIQ